MAIDPVCGMTVVPEKAPAAQWTCPMPPEIVRDAPGPCPICGMALEPRAVAAAEEPSAELLDMTRRLRVSAALTAPLLLMAMAEMWPGNPLPRLLTARTAALLQMALATPVVVWGGAPFFPRGWAPLRPPPAANCQPPPACAR